MTDFLQQMSEQSAQRAARSNNAFAAADFDRPLLPVKLQGFDIIAEIKDASPSAGRIATSPRSRKQQAEDYIHGGAVAISVLTEPSKFAGDLAHLDEVSALAAEFGVPTMRKDFLVEPSQILEARAAGASGVLLIAAMLPDAKLEAMLDCAWEHSMFVLLESFDANDLQRTSALLETARHLQQAEHAKFFAGVNTRNLRTLQVDPERLDALSKMLPAGMISVAESGLTQAEDAARSAAQGYGMALVGTALMQSDNPQELLSDMLAAGRGV